MSTSNIESQFLTELLVSKDFVLITDEGIGLKHFSGNYKQAFGYLSNHISSYGKLPAISTFQRKFPQIELNKVGDEYGTEEPLKFWCDELINKTRHNMLVEALEAVEDNINDLKTLEAYDKIKQVVVKIENDVVKGDRVKINEDTNKRFEDYKKRQRTGGMTGLPTGIDLVDEAMGGLNNGELITFMAYTGVGKSWLEAIIAVHLAKLGYKVLFITTEMSTTNLFRRIDAIWNKFDYSLFKKGQLSRKDEERYLKYLEEMENKSDDEVMLVVEQATGGVMQISAKVDQYKPDILLVDGAYLLEDDAGGEDNWMGTIRIWRAFHKLCLSKDIPVVLTTQSKDETGAKIGSLSFAKALSNECDVLAVLEQDEQQRNDKEADIRFLKLREGDTLNKIHINWNFNTMEYNSIYKEKAFEGNDESIKEAKGVISID